LLLALTTMDTEFTFLGIILGPPAFLLLPFRTAIVVLGVFCLANEALVGLNDSVLSAIYPGLAQVVATFAFGYVYYLQDRAEESRDRTQALLDELRQAHQKLAAYAAQVQESTTTEERSRLARDLHDSVKQQAFAASAQLGAAQTLLESNPAAARDHLQKAAALLDEVRSELGQMIYELRPAALQGQGLAGALREWGGGWSQQCGVSLDIRVEGERGLDGEIEQALFRIAQEALSNIARHSQARSARIELVFEPGSLRMAVCDDGRGFTPLSTSNGFGLRSMRERAERLPGGAFEVTSTPRQGTTIHITCSLIS
jgi:signal transduction histidine kinase